MPARNIAASVAEFAPDPILCWCNGLSQEARYSSSTGSGGGYPAGKVIGEGVLRARHKRARLGTAVPMPRYPLVAASAERIFLFAGPIARDRPFATLPRDQVEVRHRAGPMWRRLDLIIPSEDGNRSYTIMFFALFGNRRLRATVAELTRDGQRDPGR
jgi:hypothetical protein